MNIGRHESSNFLRDIRVPEGVIEKMWEYGNLKGKREILNKSEPFNRVRSGVKNVFKPEKIKVRKRDLRVGTTNDTPPPFYDWGTPTSVGNGTQVPRLCHAVIQTWYQKQLELTERTEKFRYHTFVFQYEPSTRDIVRSQQPFTIFRHVAHLVTFHNALQIHCRYNLKLKSQEL